MDRITESLLKEFSLSNQIDDLKEDDQFEHFAAFVTLRRHHARTFDTDAVVVGKGGGDTSIDSIAIVVNGALISEAVEIDELAQRNNSLDVNLIFTQADRGSHFESAKIGSFGFGVEDFFRDQAQLPRNEAVKEAAAIWSAILDHGPLIRAKPSCRLYYVTTGSWNSDQTIVARTGGIVAALESTQLFGSVEFHCYGASELHKLYTQTKTAVSRELLFTKKTELPAVNGVIQSYLGFVPASDFIKIISDDSGDDILGSIFDENVRDWQDYNAVNKEIRATLESDTPERFVLMNNGVTILTRKISGVGSRLVLEDFQIVNGCQTSHVLFNARDRDLSNVFVPLRLIETQDDNVKEAVVTATNQQTALSQEQLYALTEFSRQLESYFGSYEDAHKLYYERRDCQYDRFPDVPKTRIVTPQALIRAFGAMFLNEPTRVTRNYKAIRAMVGKELFAVGQKLEPYYVAAYAAYRLESSFLRSNREYKAARYHILTALRYLIDANPLPAMNSNELGRRCEAIREILWDNDKLDQLMSKAADIVRETVEGAGETFERDTIRTEATTLALLKRFGVQHVQG